MARRLLIIGVLLLVPAAAAAQAPTATEWRYGSALTLFGGGAVPGDAVRLTAGGSIAWEFTPRFSIDALGLWFSPAHRDDVVFGSVGARLELTAHHPAVPYVSAGVGLYRAQMHVPMQENETMSGFYRHRMPMAPDGHFLEGRRTFDDLAFRVGGGAEIFAGRHVSIRPEVQIVIVTDRSDAEVVPLFGLHLAYHFETHRITPNRR